MKMESLGFPFIFLLFFFFHIVYFRGVRKRRFNQSNRRHLWCLQRSCVPWQLVGCPLQDVQGEINTGKAPHPVFMSAAHHVCYGHIFMFCIILDLSKDTALYHRRHKGHPFFMWSEAQKWHSKWIMRKLFVKLMLTCNFKFCFV